MSYLKRFAWLVLLYVVVYPACTNLQISQTSKRYYENMSGTLKSFNDFAVPNPAQFSFSAMGDAHIGASGGGLLQKALQMSKADGDLFAITAGDNSNTGIDSELTTYISQVSNAGLTVYPAIGNHDIFFGGWDRYKQIIGRSIYSFNAGNVHFTFLDTGNGTFGEEQLEWLKSDLGATAKPIKIVVMHFPVYVHEISTIYKLSSDEEATYFKSIMHDNNVNMVISGHYHGWGDALIGGTRYLVTGGCNGILDINQISHYTKISVNGTSLTYVQKPL